MEQQKQLQANRFEEFVYDYFNNEWNIPISHFVTKEAQYKRGENRQGFEIKNDQRYKDTGNLYISIKRVYQHIEYPSGIYRNTKTKQRLYIIGDENKFWIIATKQLRGYFEEKRPKEIKGFTHNDGIEYGYLLRVNEADKMAVEVFDRALRNQTKLDFDGAN